jgi:hypothetical protein
MSGLPESGSAGRFMRRALEQPSQHYQYTAKPRHHVGRRLSQKLDHLLLPG